MDLTAVCFHTVHVSEDGILRPQGRRRGIVERQTVEIDGVVAHGAGESHAPLVALGTVSRVEQVAHRHDFMVDVPWKRQLTRKLHS